MTCKDCLYSGRCSVALACNANPICKNFKNKADFVEVVRCKNCTHYDDVGECEVHPHDGRFGVNYFCADGEKRE